MLTIKIFTCNAFEENTYVVSDTGGKAIIIDPGCYDAWETESVLEYVSEHSLEVAYIINTHCHIDHVLGNYTLAEHFKVPLRIHPLELEVLRATTVYAPGYGFHTYNLRLPDAFVNDGEEIAVGSQLLEILHVPGHSPGHVVLVHHAGKQIIGGDVLFKRSIGRTDLPGGNHSQLINAIKHKLFPLPDDYTVYPGHGPETTLGEEKRHNPFLR